MTAQVRRGGSKVWIDGVPEVQLLPMKHGGLVRECWVHLKGLHSMLLHRGERAAFEEVMACSGDAFHLCHGSKWEIRTGHSLPFDPLSKAASAYGYEGGWTAGDWPYVMLRRPMAERRAITEQFLSQLWAEIDAGRPLLFGGAYGDCGSWRVLVGYDLAAGQVCFVGGEQPYVWTDLWDEKAREWGFWDMQVRGAVRPGDEFLGGWQANTNFLLGTKGQSPPVVERVVDALRQAVELHFVPPVTTERYGGVTYYFGEQAYRQWAADLRLLDYPADLDRSRPPLPEIYDMSMLIYQTKQIIEGRHAAAVFCERAAGLLDGAGQRLLAAAKAYRAEARMAEEILGVFLSGSVEAQTAWLSDPSARMRGAVLVETLLALEQQAISEIEKTT